MIDCNGVCDSCDRRTEDNMVFFALPSADLVVSASASKGYDEESLRMAYQSNLGKYFMAYTVALAEDLFPRLSIN